MLIREVVKMNDNGLGCLFLVIGFFIFLAISEIFMGMGKDVAYLLGFVITAVLFTLFFGLVGWSEQKEIEEFYKNYDVDSEEDEHFMREIEKRDLLKYYENWKSEIKEYQNRKE